MALVQELVEAIKRACVISSQEEDEAEPYKYHYEAADLLKAALAAAPTPTAAAHAAVAVSPGAPSAPPPGDAVPAAAAAPADPSAALAGGADAAGTGPSHPHPPPQQPPAPPAPQQQQQQLPPPSDLELAVAAARIRFGLLLLDTDLLSEGQAAVEAGLRPLESAEPGAGANYTAWLLESYNALGALHSQRGELEQALQWLLRSEQLYRSVSATGTCHAQLAEAALPAAGCPPAAVHGDDGAAAVAAEAALPVAGRQVAPPGDDGAAAGVECGAQQTAEAGAETGPGAGAEPKAEAGGTGRAEAGGDAGAQATAAGEEGRGAGVAAVEAAAGAEAAGKEGPGRGETAEAGSATAWAADAAPAADHSLAEGAVPAAAIADPAAAAAPANAIASSSAAAFASEQPPHLRLALPHNDADAVQAQYTSTLYFLAQVYGHQQQADKSALYCAATLNRQLASGKYVLDTWVNNCLQLGGYYAKVHAYGMAMYCHAAAQAVADRDAAAGAELGEDVAANIQLAAGRVTMMRLAASLARHVEGKDLEMHYPDASHLPEHLRFPGLAVPPPDTFPWGAAALAHDFASARELFNAALPYFKAAMSYYQLDGWVTDHMGILMDMSNLYRLLAGFESDPGRVAAMHRCRAQLLEPLSGVLSPVHFPGLRPLRCSDSCRPLTSIPGAPLLLSSHPPPHQAATAASSASKFYQRFIRSFAPDAASPLPDRIDEDNEGYFLMASFGLGRMLHRMRPAGLAGAPGGPGDASYTAVVMAAHKHLQWTSEYVKKHALQNWTQEAQAAEELSELLVEQMRLRAMAAARLGRTAASK
ncbi:KIF1-binding [Tetrabaena socialis]|uniref:KIF-binding protein n=1 Tax=Tetrabaena socialis TaxID=47790 RepID=A0A2J7ZPJ3_9CHLO|nr:KIF1-binding [Tetrabaena socialis]|eukprot:PNH02188.1 KIF1-binding [Tetrabaena socialis]